MARKTKRVSRKEKPEVERKPLVSPETKNSIWAIAAFALAVLSVLSFAGLGGRAGALFTDLSHALFGWGFSIIPVAFLLLAVSFLKSYTRESSLPSILGISVFVLAILGSFFIIGNDSIFSERIGQGGYLGVILGYPLLNLFGFTSSIVVLLAAVFISFLVSMDIPLHRLFFKEKTDEDEEDGNPEPEPLVRYGAGKMENDSVKFKILNFELSFCILIFAFCI